MQRWDYQDIYLDLVFFLWYVFRNPAIGPGLIDEAYSASGPAWDHFQGGNWKKTTRQLLPSDFIILVTQMEVT